MVFSINIFQSTYQVICTYRS